MDRRTQWVVSLLVALVIAGGVGAAVLSGRGGDDCKEWQERYVAAYESFGLEPGEGAGTIQFINEGPLAGLDEARPEGCPEPR